MFLWGIITSIFWAIVVAVVLWVLCAYAGKLVISGYRMSVPRHLICFVIAIPTVILLVIFFLCNKAHRIVQYVDTEITKVMLADGRFTEQLNKQFDKTSSEVDTEELTDYLADNFTKNISSGYPMLSRFADLDKLIANEDLKKKLKAMPNNQAEISKIQQIVQTATGSFTAGIKIKIKSVRRKICIALILLQVIPFGIVFYSASKYRNSVSMGYKCNPNNHRPHVARRNNHRNRHK